MPAAQAGAGRDPSPWRRVGLVALSIALSLLFVECALRAFGTNPYRSEQNDWQLRIRLHHAGKNTPIDRSVVDPEHPKGWMRTDSRGYLLPSRRFDAPDATIAFLGGSTTECAAVAEDQRFPALVSQLLEEHGLRVDTLNAGRSGNTTHDAVNILLNHVAQDRPDVVVLMEAANDLGVLLEDPTYRTRSDAPLTIDVPLRWAVQELSTWSALIGAARYAATVRAVRPRAPSEPARLATVSTAPFEARVRAFVGVARALGMEPVLMTQPFATGRFVGTPGWTNADAQEGFNTVIRGVAESEGVVLIDLVRHLATSVAEWDRPMNVFYDGIHVTNRGSRIYAEYITQRLLESAAPLQKHRPPAETTAPSGRSR